MLSLLTFPAGKRGLATAELADNGRPKVKQSRITTEHFAVETTYSELIYDEDREPQTVSPTLDDTESRPLPLLPGETPPPTPNKHAAKKLNNSQSKGKERASAAHPPGILVSNLGWTESPLTSPRDGSDSGGGDSAAGSSADFDSIRNYERGNSLSSWARVPTFWGSEQVKLSIT